MKSHVFGAAILLVVIVLAPDSLGMTTKLGWCPLVIGGTCPDPRVRLWLHTRETEGVPELVDTGETTANLSQSSFNASNPSKVLIHGYNSGMSVLFDVKDGYLSRGAYNVFLVDWNELSPGPCYLTAVYNARFVGKCCAQLVQRMRDLGLEDIHMVGFSLGAHVAGFTGKHLKPNLLPRITGLDPAMPLFVTNNPDQKLVKDDALFVDVLHTNAFFQGKAEACGHVDFYMNGGINQPGCRNTSSPLGCDHHRANAYFAESITSKEGFWGWRCGGFIQYSFGLCQTRGIPVLIGEDVDRRSQGFHVAYTNSETPFATGSWVTTDIERLRYHRSNQSESCAIISALLAPSPELVPL